MSLPQARETSTAYRQTDWSQYISCIRYRIAWLPGGSGFGAVLRPVIVVVLKLLVVDRCPTRMSSIFGQWGSLGRLGWIMRAFYSYYAPRISPTQVDAVGCKVSGPTVRMSFDSTVFLCVSLERERERLRDWERETGRERERERERRGERDRERGREREGEKEKERREEREDSQDLPSFRAKLLFHFFCARKQTTFPPMGRVTVHWGDAGLTCMRNGDHHGAIIEADLALPIACALPPPFLLWLVAYVFNAPFLDGSSTISDEGRFESRSRRSFFFFNFGFFCSKWRLRKISKSHRQKRASPDMREHTFMTF